MAQPDNASIARTLYDDWNKRDFDHLAGLLAYDGEILLVGSGTSFRGPQGARQFSQMWADGFPDGRVTIDNIISGGDHVVVEQTGRGTQTGTLAAAGGDIPATGRSVTLQLCDVLRIEDGKISSFRSYFDSASLLMQLGVMPEARVATTS
jgi:ketosteroid isomerase-like protein